MVKLRQVFDCAEVGMGLARCSVFAFSILLWVAPSVFAQAFTETYFRRESSFGCVQMTNIKRSADNSQWAICKTSFPDPSLPIYQDPKQQIVVWNLSGGVAFLDPPDETPIQVISPGRTGMWVLTKKSLYWIETSAGQYIKYYDHNYGPFGEVNLGTDELDVDKDGMIVAYYNDSNSIIPGSYLYNLTGGPYYTRLDQFGVFSEMSPAAPRSGPNYYVGKLSDGRIVYSTLTKARITKPYICDSASCIPCQIQRFHGMADFVDLKTDRIFGDRYEKSRYVAGFWSLRNNKCVFQKLIAPPDQKDSKVNAYIKAISPLGILGGTSAQNKGKSVLLWKNISAKPTQLNKYLRKLSVNLKLDLWNVTVNEKGELLFEAERAVVGVNPVSGGKFLTGNGIRRYLLLTPANSL